MLWAVSYITHLLEAVLRFRHCTLPLLASALLFYSCAGAPPATPPPEAPPPVAAPAPAPEVKPEPTPPPAAPVVAAPEAELAKAKELRAYILANGLDSLAPAPFKQAEERYAAAEKALGSDNEAAKKHLDAAVPLYEKTIADGFGAKIGQKRVEAVSARAKADAEKAKVAAKEPYGTADAAFSKATSDAAGKRYPEAIAAYEESTKRYLEAASLAAERRAAARAALDSADATIKSTEERINVIDEEMKTAEGGAL